MITFTALAAIVILHFFADFVFQNDKMGTKKSSSNYWLTAHVMAYSAVLFVGGALTLPITLAFAARYAVANGVFHFMVDYVSSRMTSYLWKKEERHWFFVTIGADQAIHMLLLFGTYILLLG